MNSQNCKLTKIPGYIQFAIVNIDINKETLSGKGTFHTSQTAAALDLSDEEFKIMSGTKWAMQVPEDFLTLKNSDIGTANPEPNFTSEVSPVIPTKDHDVTTDAYAKIFHVFRQKLWQN